MKNKLKVNSSFQYGKLSKNKAKPKTVFDFVNSRGTFNVQATSDTENEFPQISQGLPQDKK